jgi:hypothetical protein
MVIAPPAVQHHRLAVGTGRIALPLTRAGVPVHGIAGLRLRDRWGGWDKEPFSATSRRHISVYERAAG